MRTSHHLFPPEVDCERQGLGQPQKYGLERAWHTVSYAPFTSMTAVGITKRYERLAIVIQSGHAHKDVGNTQYTDTPCHWQDMRRCHGPIRIVHLYFTWDIDNEKATAKRCVQAC